jgi:multidrug transporter EmrE-like cation transporter
MTLVIAIAAALAYTIGGVFMKLSRGFSILIPTLLVYYCFAVGVSIQTHLTTMSKLGLSYVLVLGLESILAMVFGAVIFKESYSWPALFGVVLIISGVAIVQIVPTSSH